MYNDVCLFEYVGVVSQLKDYAKTVTAVVIICFRVSLLVRRTYKLTNALCYTYFAVRSDSTHAFLSHLFS